MKIKKLIKFTYIGALTVCLKISAAGFGMTFVKSSTLQNVGVTPAQACQQLAPTSKCCVPYLNNSMSNNMNFAYVGVGVRNLAPQQMGAFYMKNNMPCPSLLAKGIKLKVQVVNAADASKTILVKNVPIALPSKGIVCNDTSCQTWK